MMKKCFSLATALAASATMLWAAAVPPQDGAILSGGRQGDSLALVALYNALGAPQVASFSGWLSAAPLNQWAGVLAQTGAEGRVVELRLILPDMEVAASLPPEIGNLDALVFLGIAGGSLNSDFPAEFANLTGLRALTLNATSMSGVIPVEIGALASLEALAIRNNSLNGGLATLISLTNLKVLLINNTEIAEELPAALAGLANIEQIDLSDNVLSGSIPAELSNLGNLGVLNLSGNALSGSIPAELGGMENLKDLFLFRNQLSGSIPAELGAISGMERLYLAHNQLDGSIPAELGNLSRLSELSLAGNKLSGEIPAALGNLAALSGLNLEDNMFSGAIPEFLGDMTSLRNLSLSGNDFQGGVPASFKKFSLLSQLGLANCDLDHGLENLPPQQILVLDLSGNRFTFSTLLLGMPSVAASRYYPQDSVGAANELQVPVGGTIEHTVEVEHAEGNTYRWFRNGWVVVEGQNSRTLSIENADAGDAGTYICLIDNALLPQLTLYSRPLSVAVGTTSVEETTSPENALSVYPNPAREAVTVSCAAPFAGPAELTVVDILGATVYRADIAGAATHTFDVSALPVGSYAVQISAAGIRHHATLRVVR